MTRRAPILSLLCASVLFGAMAVLVRMGARRGFGTWELVTWRMAIGAVGCLPFLLHRDHTLRVARPEMLGMRILIGGIAVLTYFWSIELLPVGLAALFNYFGPLFTTLFAARFLGERPGKGFLIGVAAAVAGAALTIPGLSGGSLLGVMVGLFSAVCQGAAVTFIRELRRTEGAVTIFFWFSFSTAVVCFPFAHFHPVTRSDLGVLFAMGLTSLFAQLLLTSALGHVHAHTSAALSPLTPITGFALGLLVLGEQLTVRIAAGALLAIVGVAIGIAFATPRVVPETD